MQKGMIFWQWMQSISVSGPATPQKGHSHCASSASSALQTVEHFGVLVKFHITLSMLVWVTSDISSNERRHRPAKDGSNMPNKTNKKKHYFLLRKLTQQAAGACNAYSHHVSAVYICMLRFRRRRLSLKSKLFHDH